MVVKTAEIDNNKIRYLEEELVGVRKNLIAYFTLQTAKIWKQ